jgi:hypothetical protein
VDNFALLKQQREQVRTGVLACWHAQASLMLHATGSIPVLVVLELIDRRKDKKDAFSTGCAGAGVSSLCPNYQFEAEMYLSLAFSHANAFLFTIARGRL